MSSYCMKCKQKTADKNPQIVEMKGGRKRVASNCAVCGTKKSRMVSKADGAGFLNKLAKGGVDLLAGGAKAIIGDGMPKMKRGRKAKGEGIKEDIMEYGKSLGSKAVDIGKDVLAEQVIPFATEEAVKGVRALGAAGQRKVRGQGILNRLARGGVDLLAEGAKSMIGNGMPMKKGRGRPAKMPVFQNVRTGQMAPRQVEGQGIVGDLLKTGISFLPI